VGNPAELSAAAWDLSCPDWEQRLRDGRTLVPDLPIDHALADKAVSIFNALRLPDVHDQPTLGEAGGEWFRDIVRAGFGSLNRRTRRRMIHKIGAMVPKKNNKTTGGAAIALTALLMNERPNAELQMIGPTHDVAQTAFDQAVGMIEADEEKYLQKRFHVRDHIKTIEDRLNGSELMIKTFDPKVITGKKPIFVLLDELHIMALFQFASRLFGQIEGNMQANPERLLVWISTQSDQPPAGVFRQELQYARGVRDGRIIGGHTLPVLYEFPEKMQADKARPWADPKNWPMVTPNLGLSVHLEDMISAFAEANEKGEEEVRRWASQHLNVEIGMALHTDRWRGADFWTDAADARVTLAYLLEWSEVIVAGIDGGGLDDLLALALIGRHKVTRQWMMWAKAWVQVEVLTLRPEIAERLRDFAKDGDLVIIDQEMIDAARDGAELRGDEVFVPPDVAQLADIVCQVKDAGLLPEEGAVGFDPQGVSAIVDEFAARGVTEKQMVAVPQGYRLSGAVWGFERGLKLGTVVHAVSRMLDWCIGNAKAEQRGNAVLITKETAGKAKIDPLCAGFNAFTLMSRNPEANPAPDIGEFLKTAAMFA
jgi:phage terminase large subunit-like protein